MGAGVWTLLFGPGLFNTGSKADPFSAGRPILKLPPPLIQILHPPLDLRMTLAVAEALNP